MQRSDYLQKIRAHLRTAYLLSDEKIDSVLPGFLDTLCTLITNLEEFTNDDNNLEPMNRAGHALKGALLNLGLMDLADKAFLIEKYGQPNNREIEYKTVIVELKEEITKIC